VFPVEYFDRDSVITRLCVNFLQFELICPAFTNGLAFSIEYRLSENHGFLGRRRGSGIIRGDDYWCTENVWQPGLYETTIIIKLRQANTRNSKPKHIPKII
jgi:hypothetical protein